MRFLVAPDSFKGTLSASEVAAALAAGVADGGGTADVCPVADGGEGTAAVLRTTLGGEVRTAAAHDPLGRAIEAQYVALADGETAAVDVASASGLPLVGVAQRDPVAASTYGTGELITAAIAGGARTVLLGCGGSATTDGGAGAIAAIREQGGLRGARIEVLCDVTTPFEQAAQVFGPQKGADPATVTTLKARLDALAAELPRDPRGMPMTGCAGGLSGGLWAAFGAVLRPGADFILALVDFSGRLHDVDAAITGEGRVDAQSFAGKVVGGIAQACLKAGRDLHLVTGRNALDRAAIAALPIRSIRVATTPAALRDAGQAIATEGAGAQAPLS